MRGQKKVYPEIINQPVQTLLNFYKKLILRVASLTIATKIEYHSVKINDKQAKE